MEKKGGVAELRYDCHFERNDSEAFSPELYQLNILSE
jgi:hypothetical protein